MKVVLRCRFRSLESKKVATAHAQNPQGTKANMRSSWADSIAGDEYLPAFNRLVGDINSYEKKLGSGVSYSKSMQAEFVSSAKLKQATSHNNYGDRLSACACSSSSPKKSVWQQRKFNMSITRSSWCLLKSWGLFVLLHFLVPSRQRGNMLVL